MAAIESHLDRRQEFDSCIHCKNKGIKIPLLKNYDLTLLMYFTYIATQFKTLNLLNLFIKFIITAYQF